MAKKKASKVVPFLRLVWQNAQGATEHSWERLNRALRKAVAMTVAAGFEYVPGDLDALDQFRPGYWMGSDWEWFYSLAVAEGNRSAAEEYERYMGREPIVADGVHCADRGGDGCAHAAGYRGRERLHVGCTFLWRGERYEVTSFAADGAAVAVRRFTLTPGGPKKRKVARVTRSAVIEARAERKERELIRNRLTAVKGGLLTADAAQLVADLKRIGMGSMGDLYTVPVAKLRAVELKWAGKRPAAKAARKVVGDGNA